MKNSELDQSDLDFIDKFKTWMNKNELKIETETALKLISSRNKYEGRCIISTRDYAADEPIYKIPFKFLINYRQSLRHSEFVEFYEWTAINSKDYRLTRMDALYLYLISQYYSSESELNGYVVSMPRTYDTPEYFSKAIIELLPSNFKADALKRIKKLQRKYSALKSLLSQYVLAKNNNLTGLLRTVVDEFNENNFRWVFNSVNSRCFHMSETSLCSSVAELDTSIRFFGALTKKKLANVMSFRDFERSVDYEEEYNNNLCCLMPYVDMLNHSLKPNAAFYFDLDESCYVMKASEQSEDGSLDNVAIRTNQQVYINYGAHDNRTLMIEYGFSLDEMNIYDKLVLKEQELADLMANKAMLTSLWLIANKQKLLKELSISKQGPSWSVLKVLDIICQKNMPGKNNTGSNKPVSYEIVSDSNDIKRLFVKLVSSLKKSFEDSENSLMQLKVSGQTMECNVEHVDIVLRYVKSQLSLIESNMRIVNDEQEWMELF